MSMFRSLMMNKGGGYDAWIIVSSQKYSVSPQLIKSAYDRYGEKIKDAFDNSAYILNDTSGLAYISTGVVLSAGNDNIEYRTRIKYMNADNGFYLNGANMGYFFGTRYNVFSTVARNSTIASNTFADIIFKNDGQGNCLFKVDNGNNREVIEYTRSTSTSHYGLELKIYDIGSNSGSYRCRSQYTGIFAIYVNEVCSRLFVPYELNGSACFIDIINNITYYKSTSSGTLTYITT